MGTRTIVVGSACIYRGPLGTYVYRYEVLLPSGPKNEAKRESNKKGNVQNKENKKT